jgi:nucleotide-binding universal stress UspA family protein
MLRVLLPTDFSKASLNAIVYAFKLFEGKQVWFDVLHIIPEHEGEGTENITEQIHEAKLHFEAMKHKVVTCHKLSLPSQLQLHIISDVSVSAKIGKYALAQQMDMVVMGSTGIGNHEDHLFGSVTLSVIAELEKPVLSIPKQSQYKKLQKIVYATDLNDIDFEAKELMAFAKLFNVAVHFVHVFPEVISATRFNPAHISHDLTRKYNYPHITFDAIMNNDVENGLLQFIETHQPDIVAMFTRKRNTYEQLVDKSITRKVALGSAAPIFAFRKNEELIDA